MEVLNMTDNSYATSLLPDINNKGAPGSNSGGSDNGFPDSQFQSPRFAETALPKLVDSRNKHSAGFPRKLQKPKKTGGNSPPVKSRFEDDRPSAWNPEPLPYQPQVFKSSTVLRKVTIPTRHQDTFSGKETTSPREVPVIMHSERYQWDDPLNRNAIPPNIPMLMHALQNPHLTYSRNVLQYTKNKRPQSSNEKHNFSVTQRDRHRAGVDYMERMRGMKRKREMLPHRAPHHLLLGGERAEFIERTSIQDELARLKSIALPDNARELYHGKGIQLPNHHASVKPRRIPPPDPPPDMRSKSSKTVASSKAQGSRVRIHSGASQSEAGLDVDKPWNREVDVHMQNMGLDEPERGRELESEIDIHLPVEDRRPPSAESHPPPKTAGTLPKGASPIKTITPNPLKNAHIITTLPENEKQELAELFKKLDTDSDGHLSYDQVKSQFPKGLSFAQEKYLKQVYDITNSSTFFGLEEFITVKYLSDQVIKSSGASKDAFEKINFNDLTESVIQYVELFQSVDRGEKGKITLESLEEMLCTILERSKTDEMFQKFRQVLEKENGEDINKIEYLASIPYFLMLGADIDSNT